MCERTKGIAAIVLAAIVWLWPAVGIAQGSQVVSTGPKDRLVVALAEGDLVRLSRPARSVFIANPEIADVSVRSPQLVYVFGVRPGKTTLWALDEKDRVITSMDVVVEHNLSRLQEAVAELLPGSGVKVASIDGAIVLSGQVATATDAENVRRLSARFLSKGDELINRLEVTEPNQVNLRVRISEVSRRALKNFDLNFSAQEGNYTFRSGNTFLSNPGFFSGNRQNLPLNGNSFGVAGILGSTVGNVAIDTLLEALEDFGMSRTLAEPNLTTLSGQTASFLAGGEFPVPVAQNKDAISVEFKEFGVRLAFTPTLIGHDRISLQVKPEVSQLSDAGAVTLNGFTIPSVTTRRADTTVELASGQSFAIAGLIQNDFQDTITQVPGLGEVPILGALFRSEGFRHNETELVIVVTPYIVRPASKDDLPLPTDPFIHARPEDAKKPQERANALPHTVSPPALSSAVGGHGEAGYLLD